MSITQWPENEKPREKLLQHGEQMLSNAELIAILLGCGSSKKDVLSLSRELLSDYKSLHALFHADQQSLLAHDGIGNAKFAQLKAVAEINRRYLQEPLCDKSKLINSASVKNYLISELRPLRQEVFACLFLDIKFRLLRFERLFTGTIGNTTVHPREVAKRTLELNASSVIITHNHPSGDPEPSEADKKLTRHLIEVLDLIDVRLIDHIVVGGNDTVSFAERGYL